MVVTVGRRGPAGAPTNVRILRGDRKDRINAHEPVPATMVVEAPAWLSEDARAVWDRLAGDLERKRVLTAWDVEALAGYCDAVVRRARAAAALDAEGEVVDLPVFNKNGDVTGHRKAKNPWQLVWKDADAIVQRWGARFGLTPSERQDISIAHESRPGGPERLLTDPERFLTDPSRTG